MGVREDATLVTFWMPNAEALRLTEAAHRRDLSRAQLLRQASRDIIEHDTQHEESM